MLVEVVNRPHQLRHGIVLIKNHLGAYQFRKQPAHDQDIGHVVNVDKIVALLERTFRKDVRGVKNESSVLVGVGQFAATPVANGSSRDGQASKAPALVPFHLLQKLNGSVIPSRIQHGADDWAGARVIRIARENHHSNPFAAQIGIFHRLASSG